MHLPEMETQIHPKSNSPTEEPCQPQVSQVALSLFELNKLKSHAPFLELLALNTKAQNDCIDVILNGDVSGLGQLVLREQIVGELRGLKRLRLDLEELETELTEKSKKANDYESTHTTEPGHGGGRVDWIGGSGSEPVSTDAGGTSSSGANPWVEPEPSGFDVSGRPIWDDTDSSISGGNGT